MTAATTPIYIEYATRTRLAENQALALTLVFELAVNELDPTRFDRACADTDQFSAALGGRDTYGFLIELHRERTEGGDVWVAEFTRGDQAFFVRGYLNPDLE